MQIIISWCIFLGAYLLSTLTETQALTTLDYKVSGQVMEVTPSSLSIPKGIAGSVGVAITGTVPEGSYVEAYLRGASFPARRLVGAPNAPLMLPPLNLPGDYSLDSIRLASATGETLLEGLPSAVPVKVFEELLVSRVTSRPLTLDEIQDRGIDIDESNFRAVEFEVAFVVDGVSFPVKFPVIAPSFRQTTEIIPAAELEARTLQAELLNEEIAQTVELPPELETVMPQIQVKGLNMQFVNKDDESDLALSIPPIPALMVIPGNIGFLNQFFSVQIFTENAAPNNSGLSVHSLTAEMVLPKGLDQTAGSFDSPGDDPLRFVRVGGSIRNSVAIRAAGPDGKPGTSDDIDRLQPGQTGQGELLVEGLQEGLHVMDLELKAKLDGLAAGTVEVSGKAAGSVLVRNPKFSMAFTHPRTVRSEEPYDAVVTVMNTSATTANLVSIELNGNNVSGGILKSADRVEVGNIAPGETKSATFRILAKRTGAITFSNLTTSEDSVVGRFRLKTGVDERGVTLSPDTLAMPEFFDVLPLAVRNAAQRVLGQALSTNTAGQLPPGVLRVSKRLLSASYVKGENGKPRPVGGGSMAMALLEAAQRVRYGDPLARVLPDLLLDWQGARDFDPGWDQIMRSTDAGREWREAMMLAMEQVSPAPDHAVARLVARGRDLAGRGEDWYLAASDRGGIAVSFNGIDGAVMDGNRSAVSKSGVFHGNDGDWLVLTGTNGEVLWKATDAVGSTQLSFMKIASDGTARELLWRVDGLGVGAMASFSTMGSGNQLRIDDNGDGTVDRTLSAEETPFTELAPELVSVRQDTEVLVGRPPKPCRVQGTTGEEGGSASIKNYANVLAVLFSKPMAEGVADSASSFRLESGNEAAYVKIQPGGRVALITMKMPVGGIIPRSLSVGAEVTDVRGNAVSADSKPVQSLLFEGVKVKGRVIRADGSFAANVPVTLTYNDGIQSGFGDCDPWIKRTSQVRTDASGQFAFDFVVGGIPYSLSATDTSGLSEEEINVILATSVNGEVQSDKLAELIQSSPDSLLEIFAASVAPEAIAKAEGLDRAVLHDEVLPIRHGSESNYALRFRGRGTVTGRVVLADGTTPVSSAAVNLFPDVNSRELGRGILTDSAGRFAFQGVPLGPFTIEAMTPTGLTRTVSGLLSSTGQTVDMVVSLGPTPPTYSDWQGRLVEPDGSPVGGGAVYVGLYEDPETEKGRFIIHGRATSDSNGYWSISQVPVGTYVAIGLSLDGKRVGRRGPVVSIANVPTTANIVIQARAVVHGVVQFANGDPVQGARVGGGDELARTDELGRFTLTGVPTGVGREITAGIAGDETATDPRKHLNRIVSERLNVQAGDNFVVLRFPSIGRIVGQVLDETGVPVPNEVVAIPFPGEEPYFLWVETDALGRYEAPGLKLEGPIGGAYDLSSPAPPVSESFDGAGMAALLKSAGSEEVAAIIGKAFEAFTGINNPLLNGGGPFNPAGWGFVKGVKLDFDGETEVANIRYMRRSVISGTVRNGQGVPIGARVRLTGIGPTNTGQPSFIIRGERNSDPALGTFSFDGEAFVGDWGLQAASPFFPVVLSTQGRTTSVNPNATGILMQFPAVQETNGSLTGRVLTADGTPTGAGVQVSISSGGDPRVLTTDSNGGFSTGASLYSLPGNRTYRVSAFDPATGAVAESYAYVTAGQDNQVTLTLLGRGNIEIIVQRADGSAVAGAAVDVQGGQFPRDRVTGSTDANGRFTASNVFEGPYSVSAAATIGLSRSAGRAGFVVPRGGTGTATVSLSSTATVTGTFVTTNGVTPITFANVRLGTLAYSPTDANGRFNFSDVPLGSYVLTAVDPVTGRGGNATVSLTANGEIRDVRVIETSLGTVSGLVINSFGNATVPNALVNLIVEDPFALTRSFSVTSGPDGGYSIAGVPAGAFRLRADGRLPNGNLSGEFGELRSALSVGATSLSVDIPFQPRANLIATVMEADGITKASNAAVFLGAPYPIPSVTRDTDVQGLANFGNLPLGSYRLSAISRTPGRTRDRAAAVTVNLTDRGADKEVTLNLLGVGSVQGVIFLADGSTLAPGAEAKVEVRAVDQLGGVMDSVVVGSDGAFAFSNLPAGLPITLSAKFLGLAASETVTVSNGGTTTRNLILTASGTVAGRVLRADGSTVAAGTEVTITFPSRSGLQGAMLQVVGSNGRFSFSPIPQGNYSIQAILPAQNGINFRSSSIAVNDEVDDLGDIVLDEEFPRVIATTPSNSTEGVDINSNISVVFSEPLKSSSLNATGVFLRPASGGVAVPASVFLTASNVVTIDPAAPLQSSTAYQIVAVDGDLRNAVGTITNTGPRDLVDRQLNALFTSTFVTRDQRPPAVLSFSPAHNSNQADPTSPIRLTFDEPIQAGATITLTGPSGPISGTTSLGVNNLVLAFVPTVNLPVNQVLTATVSGVRDLAGNLALDQPLVSTFATLDTLGPVIGQLRLKGGAAPASGATVLVEALLAAPETGVRYRLSANAVVVGTSALDALEVPLSLPNEGSLLLRGIAIDRFGNEGPLTEFTVNVQPNQPPVITLTRINPPAGSVATNGSFSIRVSAADDAGVTELKAAVVGAATAPLRTTTGADISITSTVRSNAGPDDIIRIIAEARDSSGLSTGERTFTIPITDGTAPSLAFAGSLASGSFNRGDVVRIPVRGQDNFGVARYTVSVSGAFTSSGDVMVDPVSKDDTRELAVIVPDDAPRDGSGFTVTIRGFDAAGLRSPTVFTSNLRMVDLTPPQIIAFSPTHNSTGLSTRPVPTVTFNEPLDPATVGVENFQLLLESDSSVVPALVALDGSGSAITLTAADLPLSPNTAYRVVVGTGVKDLTGNALETSASTLFTTAPYSITSPLADTQVIEGQPLTVTVSEGFGFLSPREVRFFVNDSQHGVDASSPFSRVITVPSPDELPTGVLPLRADLYATSGGLLMASASVNVLVRGVDEDSDNDGIPNGQEILSGTDPFRDDASEDPDGDGLTNVQEIAAGTKGNDADSDDDFLNDGAELAATTNPLDPDTDDDLIPDGRESIFSTDPKLADTDGDTLSDGFEIGFGRISLVSGSFTWAEAKADAESRGGHLLTITSALENTALSVVNPGIGNSGGWIGLSDQFIEGQFRWVTGEMSSFTNFASGHPDNFNNEDFVHFFTSDAKWNDHNSGHRTSYVIETGSFTNPVIGDTDNDGVRDDVDTEIAPRNRAPLAENDALNARRDVVLAIPYSSILGNDSDADGDQLMLTSFTQASQGTLTSNAFGLIYSPASGFTGSDSFSYTITDPSGSTATATVALFVAANRAPIAGGSVNVAGNAVSFGGSSGAVSLPNGLITATTTLTTELWFRAGPQASTGGVLFGYQNTSSPGSAGEWVPMLYIGGDGKLRGEYWQGGVNPITTASVVTDNQWHHVALVGAGSSQRMYLDGALVGTLGGTIQQLSMTFNQIGTGRTISWPSGGSNSASFMGEIDDVRVWHRALSAGEISQILVSDALVPRTSIAGEWRFNEAGDSSALDESANLRHGTLNGGVSRIASTAPIAAAQLASVEEDGEVHILPIASDADGDALTLRVTALPQRGQLFQAVGNPPIAGSAITSVPTSINDRNAGLIYVPNQDVSGSDQFVYIANDGELDSNSAAVSLTITPGSDAPVARNDGPFTTEQMFSVTTGNVLANDSDVDGETLSILDFTQAANGTVVSNGNGTFTYTPVSTFSGSDSFTYRVTDGSVASSFATVTIQVTPANIVRWINPSGGQWTTAANWSPARVPTSSDTAIVDLAGTYTITLSSGTQSPFGVFLGGTGVVSTLHHVGGVLSPVRESIVKSGSAYTLDGGFLGGAATLTIEGSFRWESGSMTGSGRMILAEGTNSTIGGQGQKRFNTSTRILENRGRLTYDGSGLDSFNNSAFTSLTSRIINGATGIWIFDGEGGITARNNTSQPGAHSGISFENAGLVRRVGVGTTTLSSDSLGATLTNSGRVEIEEGLLQLRSGGTLTGPVNVVAGTSIQFSGGTMSVNAGGDLSGSGPVFVNGGALVFNTTSTSGTGSYSLTSGSISVNGAATLNGLTMSGGSFGGSGVATITTGFDWSGGSLTGSGRLVLAEGTTSTITGTGQKRFDTSTRILENRGELTYDGSGLDSFNNSAFTSLTSRIINGATGIWIFDGEGGITARNNTSQPGAHSGISFENAGLVRRVGVGTTTLSSDSLGATLTNSGRVEIEEGLLQLRSGGTLTGPVNVVAGTSIQFSGGTMSVNAGGDLSGSGPVFVNGGALVFNTTSTSGTGSYSLTSGSISVNGAATLNGLTMSGGSFGGSGVATITTGFDWSGGSLTGSGRLVLAEGTTSTITGTGQKRFDTSTRILENRGELTYDGSGLDSFNNSAFTSLTSRIINGATGIWIFDGEGGITARNNTSQPGAHSGISFENAGLVRRVGVGTTTLSSDSLGATLTNSGRVEIEEGLLQLRSGGTLTGPVNVVAGTSIQFSGGTMSVNAGGDLSGSGPVFVNGGALVFNTTSTSGTGSYSLTSGSISVNGAATLNGLTMSGGSFGGSGVATITTGFDWSGGSLTGSGRLVLAEGTTSTITGTGQKRFDTSTRILENRGELTYDGSGLDSFNNSAFTSLTSRIINGATGIWIFDGEGGITARNNTSQPGAHSGISFENAGLVRRVGVGTTTLSSDSLGATLTNSGRVEIEEGLLQLRSGGTLTGPVNVVAGTSIQFSGGTMSVNAGGDLSGSGPVFVNGGALVFNTTSTSGTGSYSLTSGSISVNGAATLNGLTMSGGSFGGSGVATITTGFDWSGGSLTGSGRLVLAEGTTSTITGTGQKRFDTSTRILENRGELTYDGSGLDSFNNSAFTSMTSRIINGATGIWIFDGEGDITARNNTSQPGAHSGISFENAGSVRRVDVGTTTLSSDSLGVSFTNSGTVQVEAGSLQLSSGIIQSAPGSVMRLAGGTLGGSTLIFANGSITGAGTINSSVVNSGATISPDPTGTRTISITGNYTQQAGGKLELNLDSDAAGGDYDKLAVGGSASLNGSVVLRNSLALTNEVFPLVTYASRSGSFASITTAGSGVGSATYLATRADFTVTAGAPESEPVPGPQLAASYEDWVGSVAQEWAQPVASAARRVEGAEFIPPPSTWDNLPDSDPDGDGSNNLLEYAFQTNPLDPASFMKMAFHGENGSPESISGICRLRAPAADLECVLEVSDDLIHWQPFLGNSPEIHVADEASSGPGIRDLRIRMNTAEAKAKHLRWSVRLKD
jgi:hypothetical protein